MISRVEVVYSKEHTDPRCSSVLRRIQDLGIDTVSGIHIVDVYFFEHTLSPDDLANVSRDLLIDHVLQEFKIDGHFFAPAADAALFEISRKTGVMDPVIDSMEKALRDLGRDGIQRIRRATQYVLHGKTAKQDLNFIQTRLLSNPAIEDVVDGYLPAQFPAGKPYNFCKVEVSLLALDGPALDALSRERRLALNTAEMHAVQDHFRSLERNPTDLELEIIAQTWSEHCKHKTLTGLIDYNGTEIRNLLKSTIKRATDELNKPWCVSVFEDNAGIVSFDDDHCICVKVETHNHPSAIEPYGGAGTGTGGVIRDILGTGLGALPVFNTDVFCFAPPDTPAEGLPKGVIHPRQLMQGVVSGVRDYGNRMGIPTGNGAVCFDERYLGNPLVYCGTIGLLPRDMCFGSAEPGDLIVCIGGRTGRDGIGGATFSSVQLDTDSEVVSSGAVQIGNAIEEKKVLDALIQARDERLYRAITDCGAGGFSSAVGEMAAAIGARADIDKAPLKYAGLNYCETWLSEAQERMVMAVPPKHLDRFKELCAGYDVEATVLGEFTDSDKLELFYEGNKVADLDMHFLHEGLPPFKRKAEWKAPALQPPRNLPREDACTTIAAILGQYNVCSKEWIIRQYDHEVQGTSVIKPLQGVQADGPGDGAVITPRLGRNQAVVVGCGINPAFGDLDPYHMAMSAIDEALRNAVATGADPDRTAILDNFSWGRTDDPANLGAMVRACQGCYDAAVGFGTPFISGKDSLNNEYQTEKGRIVIPHTLLITAVSVIDDFRKTCTMDLKRDGAAVYLLGLTKNELGGSRFLAKHGQLGDTMPTVDTKASLATMRGLHKAIVGGLVSAAHDLSDGGLGVAAAEMAFAGGLGLELDLRAVPQTGGLDAETLLFSESNSRFLVEVMPGKEKEFEAALAGTAFARVARTTKEETLSLLGPDGKRLSAAPTADLKRAWQAPLNW